MTSSQIPIIIAPSILAADIGKLGQEIEDVTRAGADWIHIDVMDGSFVPPITFGDNVVALAKTKSSCLLDVHLMIVEPEKHIESFAKAGANNITVHQEVSPNLKSTVKRIHDLGCGAGISIRPETDVKTVYEVLDQTELILVMTVNPGWGGQPFIQTSLNKIKELSDEIKARGLATRIQVDGGINQETAKECISAGASILVAGSAIFRSKDRAAVIKQLRS